MTHIKTLLASAALAAALPAAAFAAPQEQDKNQPADEVEMSETVGDTEVTTTIDPDSQETDSDMDTAETDENWDDEADIDTAETDTTYGQDSEMDTAETDQSWDDDADMDTAETDSTYGTESDMRTAQSADMNQNTTRTASTQGMQPADIDAIVVYEVGDLNPSYLASAWLGESVYNNEGEEVGDVTDLVIDADNGVVAAVLSVGGLWDIGDTDVAVPIDEFTVTRYQNSEPKLVVAYTEDELLNASTFGDD